MVSTLAHAQVYKCTRDGSVVYQQQRCEAGPGKEIDVSPNTMGGTAAKHRTLPERSPGPQLPPA